MLLVGFLGGGGGGGGGITSLTGDVTASGTGAVAASVVGLQGNPVASGTLGDAEVGDALTWNGTEWEALPVGGAGGIPATRGLTLSLQASKQTTVVDGNVIYWHDLSPAYLGRQWTVTNGGSGNTALGTSINGNPTIDFTAVNSLGYTANVNTGPKQVCPTFQGSQLSIGCVCQYTGSVSVNTSTFDFPLLVGDGQDFLCAGLSVGIGTAGNVQFVGWVYDTTNTTLKFVESANVPASAPHYVLFTYNEATSDISIYVDNLPVVTVSGVGVAYYVDEIAAVLTIGNNSSTNAYQFTGYLLEVDGWNVTLNATEIAEMQAWYQYVSGI